MTYHVGQVHNTSEQLLSSVTAHRHASQVEEFFFFIWWMSSFFVLTFNLFFLVVPCRPKKSVVPSESAVGIDGDTEVSRVEWATAMLSVGVPRAAALTSFEAVTQEPRC